MSFTAENANTIFNQLGGTGKLTAMIGAKNFTYSSDEYFAAFKWVAKSKNKSNYIKIKLNGMDLYDIEFGRIYGTTYTIKGSYDNVYADQLIEIFESETGLYLSL